ncbi:glycosyl hydrolase family 28 protein [Niabella pedocola]|uniref:Glycosyl hydrolase family 28 protein n=1 Tax=Niabella pedocola TaxID=1752077 RepID=A0ABS8PQL8_9BACT|nr:glycosyl hydrolase family 28 protein [Niabella pedocola]MCD2422588.1 glycosyl hydrolase family 28 protein [Niabella pedocola]
MLSRRNWLTKTAALATGVGLLKPASAGSVNNASMEENNSGIYNVKASGAKGDGKTLDTKAIQSAIDTCYKNNGGTVFFPPGIYIAGTLELKSNVTLYLSAQATLMGTTDGTKYVAAAEIPLTGDSTLIDGNVGFIYAVNAENIGIEGMGTIDGKGASFRSPSKGEPSPAGISGAQRPYHILLYKCTNVHIKDIFLKDSAYHSVRVIQSDYLKFSGLRINGRVIHNNDGFHFISCKYVHVHACDVRTQDDACALFGSCQYVTVSDSTFSTRWSVFRFGGGFVQHITITNCTIYETYGCPIKIYCSRGSRFEDITFSNLIMKDVTGPIHIGISEKKSSSVTGDHLPPGRLQRITFSNIQASIVAPRPLPDAAFQSAYRPGEMRSCIVLNAFDDNFMEDISFQDIQLSFPGGGTEAEASAEVPKIAGEYFEIGTPPAYALFARNVKGLSISNLRLKVATPDARPAMVLDQLENAVISLLTAGAQGSPSVLRLKNCTDVLIVSPRVLNPATVFAAIEGADTRNIKIEGGDLTKVKSRIQLQQVPPAEVKTTE